MRLEFCICQLLRRGMCNVVLLKMMYRFSFFFFIIDRVSCCYCSGFLLFLKNVTNNEFPFLFLVTPCFCYFLKRSIFAFVYFA